MNSLGRAIVVMAASAGLVVMGTQAAQSVPGHEFLGRTKKNNSSVCKNKVTPIYASGFSLSNQIVRGNMVEENCRGQLISHRTQVDCSQDRSSIGFNQFNNTGWDWGENEDNSAKLIRARYCPNGDKSVVKAAKNYAPKQISNSSSILSRSKASTYSRPVAQASDPIHEKCLQARDYQGCVDSFSGRRSSSNSSDYEQRMLELKRQELMQQRRYAREQEEREYARAERERKREAMKLIQKGFDDIGDAFRGPDTINCSTTNFGNSSWATCY